MSQLRDLKGLGPKSEQLLIEVGINTEQELREIGAIRAFIRLKNVKSEAIVRNILKKYTASISGRRLCHGASNLRIPGHFVDLAFGEMFDTYQFVQ